MNGALIQQTTVALGANWRVAFSDADGVPLNMLSFEVIDFGAISYTEIFQNVKTILATPMFSAALERLLGVDQTIVDRPINDAAHATVAILQALAFWEPRCEATNIDFEADVLNGHLIVLLQLKINNVIYGTNTPYDKTHAVEGVPTRVTQELPPMNVPVPGPPGIQGPAGKRGSLWFVGTTDPPAEGFAPAPPPAPQLQDMDMYLNTTTGDVFQWHSLAPTGSQWKPVKGKQL